MPERRGTYFAFQGLFMAVLLALFSYQKPDLENWMARFWFLVTALSGSLVLIRAVPRKAFLHWGFQTALFVADGALATLILSWTQPQSNLYLLYFIVIFGTALTRSFTQSFIVGMVTSAFYIASGWVPGRGFPAGADLWLRVAFLWITSALMAILSKDAKQLQREQEHRYIEHAIQMERLSALGQVAGDVAHRIKGPLTTILVNTEVLTKRAGLGGEMQRQVDRIQQEALRCREIVKDLLSLGRIEETSLSPVDLRKPIRSALEAMNPALREAGIRTKVVGLEHPANVRGDESLIHEAISALLQNAVEASRETGKAGGAAGLVHLRLTDSEKGPWWKRLTTQPRYDLVIEDGGRGIAPENIEKVFEPFFTTKESGSGFGLSAALRILQKHGGAIEAQSEGLGCGSRFILSFPKLRGKGQARRRVA